MRARLVLLSCCLLLSMTGAAAAQSAETLGAKLSPSVLTMDGPRTATSIQNLGTIAVSVTALPVLTERLDAIGWTVTVEPTTLDPEQTATILLERTGPASDLTLDIRMSPESLAGMDTTALRFPVPVTDPEATTETTQAALLRAVMAPWPKY